MTCHINFFIDLTFDWRSTHIDWANLKKKIITLTMSIKKIKDIYPKTPRIEGFFWNYAKNKTNTNICQCSCPFVNLFVELSQLCQWWPNVNPSSFEMSSTHGLYKNFTKIRIQGQSPKLTHNTVQFNFSPYTY